MYQINLFVFILILFNLKKVLLGLELEIVFKFNSDANIF